jgi:DNA invertase Pin-like site-specific DNA recombinase
LDSLQKGDVLLVSELSRLGRSMLEIMQILAITAERGIRVFAVKGDWTLDGSLQSKILAMVFSLAVKSRGS